MTLTRLATLADTDPADMPHEQLVEYCYGLEARLEAEKVSQSDQSAARVRTVFDLTPMQTELLLILADGRVHSNENLLSLLYSDRPDEIPYPATLKVMISKIRSKLAAFGLAIETHWGAGYQLLDVEIFNQIIQGKFSSLQNRPPTSGRGYAAPGSIRDRVLRFLLERETDGLVHVRSGVVAKAINFASSGVTLIRNLERGGHIEVLETPRYGGLWTLRILPKAREILA